MIKNKEDASSPLNKSPTSFQEILSTLNKESEKKEAASEALRTRCNICFKEISPQRFCGGHGGGGGGGGSGEEKSHADSSSTPIIANEFVKTKEKLPLKIDDEITDKCFDSLFESDNDNFEPEVIADLIDKKLLLISNDRDKMTLSIDLQCELTSLSMKQRTELKKFMQTVAKEFSKFKEANNLTKDCLTITQDNQGNILSLRIKLPTIALYDAFIQHLAKNLLPTNNSNLVQNEKTDNTLTTTKTVNQAIENSAHIKSLTDNKETNEPTIFNPTPIPTKKTPWGQLG